MIFEDAANSVYKDNEVCLLLVAEPGEIIKVGDTIEIPMNDFTFESRVIDGMYGKGMRQICEGQWAICFIHNIDARRIHTTRSAYDEEVIEAGGIICPE